MRPQDHPEWPKLQATIDAAERVRKDAVILSKSKWPPSKTKGRQARQHCELVIAACTARQHEIQEACGDLSWKVGHKPGSPNYRKGRR